MELVCEYINIQDIRSNTVDFYILNRFSELKILWKRSTETHVDTFACTIGETKWMNKKVMKIIRGVLVVLRLCSDNQSATASHNR